MDRQDLVKEPQRILRDDDEQLKDATGEGSASLAQPASTTDNKPRIKRNRSRSPHKDSAEDGTSDPKRYRFGSSGSASPPSALPKALQLPHSTDPPSTITAKLEAILASLSSGQSIAAVTKFLATPNPNRDAVAKAEQDMHPNERMMWDAYVSNPAITLPAIDWATDIDPAPVSPRPLKTAKRRAEALNRLYNTDQAGPENAVWFTRNYEFELPLVKAMARIIGAERDICGGREGLVKADLQTVNWILGVLGEVVKKRKGGMDGLVVARAQTVLGRERKRLRGLLA